MHWSNVWLFIQTLALCLKGENVCLAGWTWNPLLLMRGTVTRSFHYFPLPPRPEGAAKGLNQASPKERDSPMGVGIFRKSMNVFEGLWTHYNF